MEITGVTPSKAVQTALAALAEIAEANAVPQEGVADPASGIDAQGLAVPRLDGGPAPAAGAQAGQRGETSTTESHASNPDARLDRGPESALVQGSARPDSPLPAASRPDARHAAAPALAGSEFALPADQLLNAAVIGLQVEPAFPWQLQRRGFDAQPDPDAGRDRERAGPHADPDRGHDADDSADDDDADGQAQGEPAQPHVQARATPCCDPVPGDVAGDWPEPVSRALRLALGERPVPLPLLAAAEQWRLGRCVVLACPQSHDPAGPAWAFVLWPRRQAFPGAPLALSGLRVDARLHWSRLPPLADWCHARVMKEQHPRQGRQLVALDARGTATVPCEVQLGPLPLRTPRWRDVCVRVDAVRHFWSALGQQWSVTVVVGSRPLAGLQAPAAKEPTWPT